MEVFWARQGWVASSLGQHYLFCLPRAFFLWSLAGTSLGSIGEASPVLHKQRGGKQQTVPYFSVEVEEKNIQIQQSLSTEIILSTKLTI